MKVKVRKSVLSENDQQAAINARRLAAQQLVGVNVLAAPGAGKTSLIVQLLKRLPRALHKGVIEGDVAGSLDTALIRKLGFPAHQINTGGGCHLSAKMVAAALDRLRLKGPGVVFIENIGNLICPVNYRLGESLRLVLTDVGDGDDKPVKYPGIFAAADAVVLNKIDLVPHMNFRMRFFRRGLAAATGGKTPLFLVSCRTGEGLDAVADWLIQAAELKQA